MKQPTVEELLQSDWPFEFVEDFEAGCPCCTIIGDGFSVETHCWRTSKYDENGNRCKCEYSGIHVYGLIDQATKQKIGEHIRDNNGWSNRTDYDIVIEEDSVKTT